MINKVILLGRVGKDAEIKNFEKGNSLVKFSLATNENYKNKEGEWVEKTEWHNVVVWTQNAEQFAQKFVKGAVVYIEGKVQTRSWDDQNGQKKYMTEISATWHKLLSKSKSTENVKEDETVETKSEAVSSEPNAVVEDTDDLPF